MWGGMMCYCSMFFTSEKFSQESVSESPVPELVHTRSPQELQEYIAHELDLYVSKLQERAARLPEEQLAEDVREKFFNTQTQLTEAVLQLTLHDNETLRERIIAVWEELRQLFASTERKEGSTDTGTYVDNQAAEVGVDGFEYTSQEELPPVTEAEEVVNQAEEVIAPVPSVETLSPAEGEVQTAEIERRTDQLLKAELTETFGPQLRGWEKGFFGLVTGVADRPISQLRSTLSPDSPIQILLSTLERRARHPVIMMSSTMTVREYVTRLCRAIVLVEDVER